MKQKRKRDGFLKVHNGDLEVFGWPAAGILAYVAEFEARNQRCWVSHDKIADRVKSSVATVRRQIDRLVKCGALRREASASRRYLETTPMPLRWGDAEVDFDEAESDYVEN
jgi:DNA-binding MarR family transcriptional regulator